MINEKLSGENERQYVWRIGQAVDKGELTWKAAAEIINKEWREDESEYRDESAYRKPYQYAKGFYEDVFSHYKSDEYSDMLNETKLALQKEKVQLSDQRRELGNIVRKEARAEHLTDVLKGCLDSLNETLPLSFIDDGGVMHWDRNPKEAVLVISDLHYGMVTDNIWQVYNTDICKVRMKELVERTKEAIETHGVEKLHVFILGDLIHGAIHTSCRVASEELVVEQLIHATELVAESIYELSKINSLNYIYIYNTYGNHARITQNKDEAIHEDNLEQVVPWFLKERFRDNIKIIFPVTEYEFITAKVAGKNIVATHGDLEAVGNFGVVANTLFTKKNREPIDIAIMGDKHHLESCDKFAIESIVAPSLCGVDEYANNKRLYSKAAQLLLIFDPEHGKECTYEIAFEEDDD